MSVNLSVLSAECILEFLDVNKRCSLILQFSRIRKIERPIPLKISKLTIGTSRLYLEDDVYELVENRELTIWRTEKNKGIREKNRIVFFRALEEYERGDGYKMNPFRPWNGCYCTNKDHFESEVAEMINSYGGFGDYICFEKTLADPYSNPRTHFEKDKIAKKYPKAYNLILKQMGSITKSIDSDRSGQAIRDHHHSTTGVMFEAIEIQRYKLNFLKYLAWPVDWSPASIYLEYPKSLPKDEAFNKLLSVLFEGRKIVQVEDLRFDGEQIFDFPMGLEFNATTCRINQKKFDNYAFMKHLQSANHIVIDAVNNGLNLLELPIVRSCEILTLWCTANYPLLDSLPQLNNKILFVGDFYSLENMGNIIESWLKNSIRKTGSKLVIGIPHWHKDSFFEDLEMSRLIRDRLGFRNSMFEFYRPMDGNKNLVLEKESDAGFHFKLPHCQIKRCIILEIKDSR